MAENDHCDGLAEEILRVVRDGAQETLHLEFKAGLEPNVEDWLEEITAFANTAGGRLYVGIEEGRDEDRRKTGRAGLASGLDQPAEELRLKFLNALRDSVEPRLSVRVHSTTLDKLEFLVIETERSPVGPHFVRSKRGYRCFMRNDAGKYPLDAAEIRRHMLQQDAAHRTIHDWFVTQRFDLEAQLAKPGAPQGPSAQVMVAPLLGVVSQFSPTLTDLVDRRPPFVEASARSRYLSADSSWRHNLGGVASGTPPFDHVQFLRDGRVEMRTIHANWAGSGEKELNPMLPVWIGEGISDCLNALLAWGATGPCICNIILHNMAGTELGTIDMFKVRGQTPHEHRTIELPDFQVDLEPEFIAPLRIELQRSFDVLANANGLREYPAQILRTWRGGR